MASDNKSMKSFRFRETAEEKVHKHDIQHKPGSLQVSQINKTEEYTQQAQVRQVVDDTLENLFICMEYCGTCPSLPFPPEPLLFCARGCSLEIVSKKSCNCPACPVYKKYRLQNLYFCETGKATEKRDINLKQRVN